VIKGGSFLIQETDPAQVFTPEDFTDEQRMIYGTAFDFVKEKVEPRLPEIEANLPGPTPALMKEAGELGLLSVDVPEKYGGMGLDKVTSTLVAEAMAGGCSFIVSFSAHTGIGTLPIVYFGNPEQKAKYLPGLASGELLAAYALTEPGSGSDALSAKTKAVLSDCGKYYILNGTKQFITNAGFADVFIVYAKVDGEKFTAFIVDRDTEGLSLGPEEHKMGIKGSSTRSVILENAKVPVENVLGEVGRGHVVAFNILNVGRHKLAGGCVGSIKGVLQYAVRYAQERYQFGVPIASFGLIQEKLARMATLGYVTESMAYRSAGLMDEALVGVDDDREKVNRIEEYAVECSINKVFSSEALDYAVDEGVQIYGGYGYSQEYPVERFYRDSRINRIFEGTNEVNRLLIPGTLFRRAMKGHLPLVQAAQQVAKDLLNTMPSFSTDTALFGEQVKALEGAKKATLMVAGIAAQKYMEKLERQQEILGLLADMVIQVYAMESALLRAKKAVSAVGEAKAAAKVDMVLAYFNDAIPLVEGAGREALAAMAEGDELRTNLAALKRLIRYNPVNGVDIRRRIAARVLEAGGYVV